MTEVEIEEIDIEEYDESRDDYIPDCTAEEMADHEEDNYCRTYLGWNEATW